MNTIPGVALQRPSYLVFGTATGTPAAVDFTYREPNGKPNGQTAGRVVLKNKGTGALLILLKGWNAGAEYSLASGESIELHTVDTLTLSADVGTADYVAICESNWYR